MSLKEVLAEKPSSPYHKLPPLRILIVEIIEKPRVVTWEFQNDSVTAGVQKLNKLVSITDGSSVAKFTVLEEISCQIKEGVTYMMRGYNLWGQHPPFSIGISKHTIFFRTTAITASEEVLDSARNLLNPCSTATTLRDCQKAKGFLSVQGVVMEVSAIKKVTSGKEEVPIRTILLQQDKVQVPVSLWREAALFDVTLGEMVSLTHLKHTSTDYGLKLHTTVFTKMEAQVTDTLHNVEVVGVVEDSKTKGMLNILLGDDSVLVIDAELWEPFDEVLKNGMVVVTIVKIGNRVTTIRPVENQK